MENEAVPALSATGRPRLVAPSKNSTVPVAAAGVTVAVNVTVSPNADGFRSLTTMVVLTTWFTV